MTQNSSLFNDIFRDEVQLHELPDQSGTIVFDAGCGAVLVLSMRMSELLTVLTNDLSFIDEKGLSKLRSFFRNKGIL